MRQLFVLAGAGGLGVALAGACSASSDTHAFGDGGASSSQSGGAGPGTSGTGGGDVGGFGFGGQGGGCASGCSADGHDVVGCDGVTVVKACGATELCANGTCENACQAAIDNKSSIGCAYWAVDMEGYATADGGCFTSFVANTFPTPAHLTVTFGGQAIDLAAHARIPTGSGKGLSYGAFDPAVGIPPGQVAILFLAGTSLCPVGSAMPTGAQFTGTGLGKAFRIESDVPVVAYQMLPFGGGSAAVTGASLLLPTSAWDTNYIAVNAYPQSPLSGAGPTLDIVADADGTDVTILPKVAITGGNGVAPTGANQPVTYTLSKGQVLQITQPAELTGSPIQSTKPIGFWGGHPCLTVPLDKYACDHAEQQIPPVRALGHVYAGVSHAQRSGVPENPPWRVIGAVDGTTLTFDPPIPGAPAAIGLGEIAELTTYTPFVVSSQDDKHPFILVTYMTGEETVEQFYGDADFVRITPTDQYLRRYVFFTDPTYSNTNIVLVRKKGMNGFADVKSECAGTLSGWAPIGASGELEWMRLDMVRGDFQPQNGCDNGRHELESEQPFGAWVWGWGTPNTNPDTISVSYGYPAGEGVTPVNDVVVPPVPK